MAIRERKALCDRRPRKSARCDERAYYKALSSAELFSILTGRPRLWHEVVSKTQSRLKIPAHRVRLFGQVTGALIAPKQRTPKAWR